MAYDWLRMRTDLYRDPKVIVMAESLMDRDSDLSRYVSQNTQCDMSVTRNVTRHAVVGALLSVWGVARHQGRREEDDLRLRGVTAAVVDDIADMPGFGDAMVTAGWLVEDTQGVVFPKFYVEHNTDPKESKREADRERQRRKRERDKGRDMSRDSHAQMSHREEKRREEKSIKDSPPKPPKGGKGSAKQFDPLSADMPPELDSDSFRAAWVKWVEHRREIGKRLTPQAVSQQLGKLATFGDREAVAKIETAIANGWQGVVFDGPSRGSPPKQAADKFQGNREFIERFGNASGPIQSANGTTHGGNGEKFLG